MTEEPFEEEGGTFYFLELKEYKFFDELLEIVESPMIWTKIFFNYVKMHNEFNNTFLDLSSMNMVFDVTNGDIFILVIKEGEFKTESNKLKKE